MPSLSVLACLAAVAAASEPSPSETCVQDAVSAVQARRAVPEVREEPEEEESGVDLVSKDMHLPDRLLVHKEIHMELLPEFQKSRIGLLAMVQRGHVSMQKAYDCEKYPHMCQAPFNCQNWTLKDTLKVMINGFAVDGRANPRSWCLPGAEEYADSMLKECVAQRNPRSSASLLMSRSADLGHQEMDASYCFAEGHCSNEAVTDSTTVEEAEAMCDRRFTREGWTSRLLKSLARTFSAKSAMPSLMNVRHGFNSRMVTAALTKMSCAQGVYQCDVQYCKHTYCKDERYISKYNFLKPMQAGHLIQDQDV